VHRQVPLTSILVIQYTALTALHRQHRT